MQLSNAIKQVEKHVGKLTIENERFRTKYWVRRGESILVFYLDNGEEEISGLRIRGIEEKDEELSDYALCKNMKKAIAWVLD